MNRLLFFVALISLILIGLSNRASGQSQIQVVDGTTRLIQGLKTVTTFNAVPDHPILQSAAANQLFTLSLSPTLQTQLDTLGVWVILSQADSSKVVALTSPQQLLATLPPELLKKPIYLPLIRR